MIPSKSSACQILDNQLLRQLLPLCYQPLRLSSYLAQTAGFRSPRLRVLLYHDVAPHEIEPFYFTLRWLKSKWNFLTPGQFEDIVSGSLPLTRDSLLLTFDDGFASNLAVAEQVLRPLAISAIFFVVPDFVGKRDLFSCRNFVVNRLKTCEFGSPVLSNYRNLGWSDLSRLLDLGHTIGFHTKSHARLSELNPAMLRNEIISGVDEIETNLSFSVRHFAFPFGNLASISRPAFLIAAGRFDFVYSGLRGDNSKLATPRVIRRDSLTPSDSHELVGSFLLGASDFRYDRANKLLDSWSLDNL